MSNNDSATVTDADEQDFCPLDGADLNESHCSECHDEGYVILDFGTSERPVECPNGCGEPEYDPYDES